MPCHSQRAGAPGSVRMAGIAIDAGGGHGHASPLELHRRLWLLLPS